MRLLYVSVLTFGLVSSLGAQTLSEIQENHQNNQNHHLEQIKKAMRACTAMTQDGDVKGRNMARNVQLELGDTCIVQKPSIDSITLLNKQINSAFQAVDATELWSDINNIALERTLKSVWSTHMRLIKDEKLTQAAALALVCKHTPALCKNPEDAARIKAAFKSFQKDQAAKPIKFLTGAEQNKILQTELKPLIERANKTCAATRKKYYEIKNAYSCMPVPDLSKIDLGRKAEPNASNNKLVFKPLKPMSQIECDERLRQAYQKHRKLQSIATESIELDMHLIVGSQLGSLLITEDLRQKMGVLKDDFVYQSCMKGEGSVLNQIWNKDLLKARSDFYALTIKELKKIQDYKVSDYSAYSKKQTLKQYLKTNPSTVAELLNKTSDPNKVYAMCSLIKTIQGWDKAWQIVDGVVIGTGVVASIALGFTGFGVPASALLANLVLGSTAVSVSKSAIDYASAIHQDGRLRSAVATQQKKLEQGLADLKVSDERKEGYLDNIKFNMAAEVAGFGLGKGIKYLATLQQAKAVNNLVEVAPMLKGAQREQAIASKLEAGAKKMKLAFEQGGTKTAHLTKVNATQEAKLAAIYSNLDATQAQALTKKLAGLKTQQEINKFLLNIEKNAADLKATRFDKAKLAKLVDQSKNNPPLYIRVETNPKTAKLFKNSAAAEQTRLIDLAKRYQSKSKLPEEEIFTRLSKLEERCLINGVLKKGCLQTQLTKLERELSETLLAAHMDKMHKASLAKAATLEKKLKASKNPVVYDGVFIGGGPHNSIAVAAFREANPKLKVLVIEATESHGVFDALKGFDINTPEFLKASGNTYPGSSVQLKDFNLSKRVYASAEELGDLTKAAYLSADPDIIFNNKVVKWSKEPAPGAWPAPHKIETSNGVVVYTHVDFFGTGFGNPITRLKDPKSIELIAKHEKELKSVNLLTDVKYAPKIQSVDDFIALAAKDVAAKRSATARYKNASATQPKKRVLMVGSGDGGNIGIEAMAGLKKELNPNKLAAEVETIWLGQEAKNGEEFLKSLNDRKINRYGKIAKAIDEGSVKPVNGYLSRVEEFKDAAGETKFRAYYTLKDGTPIGQPIEVDHIVFSTGYPNDPKTISPLFAKMAKNGNLTGDEISYQTVSGKVDDYTPYQEFKGEGDIAKQLVINGEAQNSFLVGNVAKVHIGSADWDIPTGGLLDINGPRSAATAKMVAEKITAERGMQNVHQLLEASPGKISKHQLKAPVALKTSELYNDLAIANVDMKIQLNKTLRNFKSTPAAEFMLKFSKNSSGEFQLTINGLDPKSAQAVSTALAKNPDIMKNLQRFSKLKQNTLDIRLTTRSDGLIKFETMEMSETLPVNAESIRVVASKPMEKFIPREVSLSKARVDPGPTLVNPIKVTEDIQPYYVIPTLKAVQQKLTKYYVNTIKAVTKDRQHMTILADGGIELNLGKQLGKGSRGVVADLDSYSNLPNLQKDGEYVAKLAHTLKGQKTPLSAATASLKRELEVYDEVLTNLDHIKTSKYYPKDAAWGESMPLCKIHYSMQSPEGLVLVKDKIKGDSIDKFLAKNGGKLTPAAEKSLKEVYDLNQALYEKQRIVVEGIEGKFSGDIAKANLMWVEDPKALKQLGYKRPGFVLLELDIHYQNGPKFIEGNMSFEEYMQYVINN